MIALDLLIAPCNMHAIEFALAVTVTLVIPFETVNLFGRIYVTPVVVTTVSAIKTAESSSSDISEESDNSTPAYFNVSVSIEFASASSRNRKTSVNGFNILSILSVVAIADLFMAS